MLKKLKLAHSLSMSDRAVSSTSMQATNTEWFSLGTYAEALKLNRLFIMGLRKASIYYWASLDPESEELIPGLLDLHNYGLLTHDSQHFEGTQFTARTGGAYWTAGRQRPYISFLIPTVDCIPGKQFQQLSINLLDRPEIIIRVLKHDGKRLCTKTCDDHVVTQSKEALSVEELFEEPWGNHSGIPSKETSKSGISWNVEALERAKCLDISVASRSWDRDVDLAVLVKDTAVKAGIRPVYDNLKLGVL